MSRHLGPIFLGALVALTRAEPAFAGYTIFASTTDAIEVGGQSELGSAATIEAVILVLNGEGGGYLHDEWTEFQEDKLLFVSPTFFQAYLHPLQPVLSGGLTMSTEAWHHVAFVYDGAEQRFYLDGSLVASFPMTGMIANATGLAYIGATPRGGACQSGFVGYVDSLRVSKIGRYEGSSFTAPTGDLSSDADTVLLYNFNELFGSTTVEDSSPLGRDGITGLGCPEATSPTFSEGASSTTSTTGGASSTTVTATSTTTITSTTTSLGTTTTTTLPAGACGDPVDPPLLAIDEGGRQITATDALAMLRVAVGLDACALCVCDVDGSSAVTATDALITLNKAVGQDVPLLCPPCS